MPVTIFRNWNFAASEIFHIFTQLFSVDQCLHGIDENAFHCVLSFWGKVRFVSTHARENEIDFPWKCAMIFPNPLEYLQMKRPTWAPSLVTLRTHQNPIYFIAPLSIKLCFYNVLRSRWCFLTNCLLRHFISNFVQKSGSIQIRNYYVFP